MNNLRDSNILVNAYNRDYQRGIDTKNYYAELDRQRKAQENKLRGIKRKSREINEKILTNSIHDYQSWKGQHENKLRDQKRIYAETLKKQIALEKDAKLHGERMGRVQKAMNRDNLNAYGKWDPNNYAAIPGWGSNAKYYDRFLGKGNQTTAMNTSFSNSQGFRDQRFGKLATDNLLAR